MKPKVSIQNVYPLTPMQEGMLFHSLLDPASAAYFEQAAFTIKGELDIAVFENSFNETIQRYDILRTVFRHDKVEKPLQVVLSERVAKLFYEDISGMDEDAQQSHLDLFREQDKKKGFDLAKNILTRISVFRRSCSEYAVIWSHHHILMDGWCLGIIIKDFLTIYTARVKKETPVLHKVVPYSNYIAWLEKQEKEKAASYWKDFLSEYDQQATIPQSAKARKSNYTQSSSHFKLSKHDSELLQQIASRNKVTINVVIQAIWGILLQRYNNTRDVVFGSVVSGRPPGIPGIESMVGLFINTIPVRVSSDSSTTFTELLQNVQQRAVESAAFDYFPLAEIQSKSGLKGDLLNNIIVFENYPVNKEIEKSEITGSLFEIENVEMFEQANYDLVMVVFPGEELGMNLDYNSAVYDPSTIEAVKEHFRNIVSEVAADPSIKVSAIQMLAADELHALVTEYNSTETSYPKDKTLHQLFEEQVERTPGNIAVIFNDEAVTYSELNARANRLAWTLKSRNVACNDIIGIMVDKSVEMVVAMLAVLKAGAAYLPIDPNFPAQRISFMLDDSKAKILLSQAHIGGEFTFSGERIDLDNASAYSSRADNPETANTSSDLAYVIYTSGSTGNPKGTLTMHYNVSRVVLDTNYISITPADRILQLSNFAFDGSVFDLYGALLNGATLLLPAKEDAIDPSRLASLIGRENISVLFITTALLNSLVDTDPGALKGLRKLLFGGERVSVRHAVKALAAMGKGKLVHMYGPTESTVYTTFYNIDHIEEGAVTIPIGKPLSNTEVYVLTQDNRLQPIGVPGELCVSGDGLAKGYLNQPELTASKFIDHPFKKDQKLYRSGDLVRMLPGGSIEFLDRIDKQVKIRGFRIELGEIESRLLAHPSIHECVVVARQDANSDKFLCAYVVSDKQLTASELREFLSSDLPAFIIPSYFILLDRIPVTPTGKIDTKALPLPGGNFNSGTEYIAPSNETETKLAETWKQVLGAERVGVNDNFFDLGGHSLKATVLASRINKAFEKQVVSVGDIFNYPTVQELANFISGRDGFDYDSIAPAPPQPYYDLSNAQKQLWLIAQLGDGNSSYNITGASTLEGRLDVPALDRAFAELARRHEALRTRFVVIDGEPKQEILPAIEFKLDVTELSNEAALHDHIEKIASHSFDLTNAPLIMVRLFRISPEKHVLAFSMHHIISDGWSMQVIGSEVIALYNAYAAGKPSALPALRIQFKDYVHWENKVLSESKMAELSKFWKQHFGEKVEPVNLPIDKIRPLEPTFNGRTVAFNIGSDLSNKLRQLAREQNVTLNVFFLGLYNIFLSKISGDNEITVRSITTGRNHSDLENIAGYFVRVFAMKNMPAADIKLSSFLGEVRARYLQVIQNDLYPFEKIIDHYRTGEHTNRNLVNVSFAMQNLDSLDAMQQGEEFAGLRVTNLSLDENTAKNDLLLTVIENGSDIQFSFNYNTDLFVSSRIALFVSWFRHLLEQSAADPNKLIEEYRLGDGTEKELFDHLEASKEEYTSIHPLTTVQRDLYLDSIFNPDDSAHSLAFYIEIEGSLDIEKWNQAIQMLVDSSPALKTGLIIHENEVYQGIRKNFNISSKLIELKKGQDAIDIINSEAKVPYDFRKDPLLRHVLIRKDSNKYISLLCAHHVIFDGWSIKLFFEKVSKAYNALLKSETVSFVKDSVFLDYIGRHLRKFDTPEVLSYWKDKLSNAEPLHFSGAKGEQQGLVSKHLVLPAEKLESIEKFCKASGISVSLYIKSLFALLVRYYCRAEEDFTIRELLGGRGPEHMDAMGCFYQSIPVCFSKDVFSNSSPLEYFSYVKQQKKELGDSENISFLQQNKIIGEEEIVFYYNYQTYFQLNAFGKIVPLRSINTYSENQVQLLARETAEGLRLILDYDGRFFNDYDLLERLIAISDQVTAGAPALDMLSYTLATERQAMLGETTEMAAYPSAKLIHEIFEEQAALFPNKVAVVSGNVQLTYKELDERANRLANFTREKYNVQPGDLIGIMMDRSEKMITGILAILKAGGAYVPVDPEYPAERIDHMLADSNVKVLLTESRVKANGKVSCPVIDVDSESESIASSSGSAPKRVNDPSDIAYIIYTSGSTGLPKGTMVEHRNVVQLLFNDRFQFDFTENDVWTVFHSFCFDFSVWEMYGALLRGGKVVVVSKETAQDPAAFLRLLEKEKVTVLNQIPSLFNNLSAEAVKDEAGSLSIRYVIFGGEALKPYTLKDWHAKYPATKLINMYGITETTVHVTYKEIGPHEIAQGASNIGKPLPTLSCLIMDKSLNAVPNGIAGEICVGGAGVSRGYLNRAELTAQRFIPDPFIAGGTLYRSGDLGRILPNGDIEYLGRIDHQVKVRGFRIELGEIENVLTQHQLVEEAVVISKQFDIGENELVAYVKAPGSLDISSLRTFLLSRLPGYMIPSYFVVLESFPFTPSGKIDKKALPNPLMAGAPAGSEFIAPRNATEKKLAAIWQDVLGRAVIGVHDNFFEIGGHSLKATQLINRIHKYLQADVTVRELFTNPTIDALSKVIAAKDKRAHMAIEPVEVKEHYDVSNAQWRLWLLDKLGNGSVAYNIPVAQVIEGPLDKAALTRSFDLIIARHESLRTTFITVNGQPKQVVHPNVQFKVDELDISAHRDKDEQAARYADEEAAHCFELSKGPLLRARLLKMADNKHLLLFTMHHIISDGWSMGVIINEFITLYESFVANRKAELPALRIQYKDYAAWQQGLLKKATKLSAYWNEKLSGEIPLLNMHTDFERPEVLSHKGQNISFEVDKEHAQRIRTLCKENEASTFMFMLAAVKILLYRYSNQEDIIIGTPVAGRSHIDLAEQVGLYVNTLVLRGSVKSEDSFIDVLKKVKQTTLEAYEHEMYPFDKLVEDKNIPRSANRNPFFDVMVVMQNMDQPDVAKNNGKTLSGLSITGFEQAYQSSKFDLTFTFIENDDLSGSIQYDTALYKKETVEKMADRLNKIIAGALDDVSAKIGAIRLEEADAVADMNTTLDFNF